MAVPDQRRRPLLAAAVERRPLVVGQRLGRPHHLGHGRAVQIEQRLLVHAEARPPFQRLQRRNLERRREPVDRRRRVLLEAALAAPDRRRARRPALPGRRADRRALDGVLPDRLQKLLGDAGARRRPSAGARRPRPGRHSGAAPPPGRRRRGPSPETQTRSQDIPSVCQIAAPIGRCPASGWTRGQVWERQLLRVPSRRKNMATPTRSGRRNTRIIGEPSRSTGLPEIVQDGRVPGACSPPREDLHRHVRRRECDAL